MTRILVINPNTSLSITTALQKAVSGLATSPDLVWFTPKTGVPAIVDDETAITSRNACLTELGDLSDITGIVVCCFRDHPLIPALRERYPQITTIGMFHAGVSAALLNEGPFGIIATGTGEKRNLIDSVAEYLGSTSPTRLAGVLTTGLGVVELQEGDQEKVERLMKETTVRLVKQGARTLILGCAGMSGMEGWIVDAGQSQGVKVKVIDAARAGVAILSTGCI